MTEIEFRKGVHVKLFQKTHAELRVISFRAGVSVQEILEEFAVRLVAGERQFVDVVEDLAQQKKNKLREQLRATDAASLFDVLDLVDPFEDARMKAPGTKSGPNDDESDT